jgi:hypothetical protein
MMPSRPKDDEKEGTTDFADYTDFFVFLRVTSRVFAANLIKEIYLCLILKYFGF